MCKKTIYLAAIFLVFALSSPGLAWVYWDNSGDASSFYHTNGIDVNSPGYTQIKVTFWFIANGMGQNEDFFVEYYDGSSWNTVATYKKAQSGIANNKWYRETVYINEGTGQDEYTFPSNMKIKFRCDAGADNDDVYIDEVTVSAMTE